MNFPIILSDSPFEYIFAVSMVLRPLSHAAFKTGIACDKFVALAPGINSYVLYATPVLQEAPTADASLCQLYRDSIALPTYHPCRAAIRHAANLPDKPQ